MARWDEILTLPVQNPPTLEFSSADIVWSRVEGWQDGVDRVALIPFSRVNDFVRGESNKKECPTRFHVEARRRRPPEMAYKPKVDGILEYILYWCSFGPDDHRKGGVVRPSRNYTLKRKTPAGRPSTKRGCCCHFIVKRLIAEPSVALIVYNFEKHIDKQGFPCHGPQDKMAVGTRAMFAPYISEELRLQVTSLLYVGVPVETIMQRHTESVEKQGGPCNRDDLLTHRYVRRLERKIRRTTHELDPDDAISIKQWVDMHQSDIFFYRDYSDTEPFVLGIQTEWQLQQMIQFGNRSLIFSDSRFGTNKLKCPVQSLLVFDLKSNAIPVAWIIAPEFASSETHRWLRALFDRVYSKDPTWRLGGFIIDDPSSDIHLIREVFQCSVLISLWHVRRAWHKNLMRKCSDVVTCVEISKQLGKILSYICRENGSADAFDNFMEDFVDCSGFIDYFKATWYPRLEAWTDALKTLPLAGAETSAAIECYHHQMKLRLLNEKDPTVYRRSDWLVYKLSTKVHSYYWLDEYAEKDSFARYWKNEWKSGFTSWQQALQIPDNDIILGTGYAKISSKKKDGKEHTVWNPGSESAICDCSWSRMGNLCKHVIKVSQIYRGRGLTAPSISLFDYKRTLTNILSCSPHDSLIRDHSIALAVSVQMQLNALSNLANSGVSPSMHATAATMTHENGSEMLPSSSDCHVADEAIIENAMIGATHSVQPEPIDRTHADVTSQDFCVRVNTCATGTSTTGVEKDDYSNAVIGETVSFTYEKSATDVDDSNVTAGDKPLTNFIEGCRNEGVVSSPNSSVCQDVINISLAHQVMGADSEHIQSSSTKSRCELTDDTGRGLQEPFILPCHKELNDRVDCSVPIIVDGIERSGKSTEDSGNKGPMDNCCSDRSSGCDTIEQKNIAEIEIQATAATAVEYYRTGEVEIVTDTTANGYADEVEPQSRVPGNAAQDSDCNVVGVCTIVAMDFHISVADVEPDAQIPPVPMEAEISVDLAKDCHDAH